MNEAEFYLKRLERFVGKKVEGLAQDDEGYFGLVIDGQILWFFSDDEGNAPGSFEIQKANP